MAGGLLGALGGAGQAFGSGVNTYNAMEAARLKGLERQILAAQLQDQQDMRKASFASMLDQGGGVDPTTATLMALSGGQDPSQGGGQPGGMPGQPPMQPMPQGDPGGSPAPQMPQDAIPGSPGMMGGGGMSPPPGAPGMGRGMPAQPMPNIGRPSSPMPGASPALGQMPNMGGGQMSLGQMFQRLRSDPKNQGIPDATLLQMAVKVQQAMMPADRMLLQYMMKNQITPYQQAQLGLGEKRLEQQGENRQETLAYRKSMLQFMQEKNVQMMPGMGEGKDGKQVPGAYIFDRAAQGLRFIPTGGAMGAGAVKDAAKADREGGALIDKDTAKMIADRAKAGDSTAMSGLGFGNTGAKNRALVYKSLQDQGVTGADLAKATIAFRGASQAVKSVETQGAKIDVAANEMKEFGPKVLEASKNIDRTQYKSLNSLMNSWSLGSGGKDIIELGDWVNAMQNAYAQVVTRGGQSTEGARHKAEEVLNKAWSEGQLERGVSVLMQEADAAMRATQRASGNVIGRVGNEGPQPQQGGQGGGAQPTVSNW